MIKFSHQCLRQVIHQKVAKNVEEEAGNVESICFWSDDQFDLVSSCKNQRRVLFDSAFSTEHGPRAEQPTELKLQLWNLRISVEVKGFH